MNRTDDVIRDRWHAGVLAREIAAETGLSLAAVYWRTHKMGLPERKRGRQKGFAPSPKQLDALRRGPLVSGKTQQERAWERAQQRMRELGIPA